MNLVERDEGRSGSHDSDGAAPVLRDRLPVVAGAQADVEPGAYPFGHASAPAEEAVRNAFERAAAQGFYRSSFHISSSSAWSPTMNL
jgi:hypothetical protein